MTQPEREKITLHVCEGEKCADALADLGLLATTSQGGASAAGKTDWSPAARCDEVIVWKDVDAIGKDGRRPGDVFAEIVTEKIRAAAKALGSRPVILVVDLRSMRDPVTGREIGGGLADGEDVYDWIEMQRTEGKEDDAIRAGLLLLAYRYSQRQVERLKIEYPGQPKPLQRPAAGERADIDNFTRERRERPKRGPDGQPTGETEVYYECVQRPIGEIGAAVQAAAAGWPCRLRAPGARSPMLFVEEEHAQVIRWMPSGEQFETWLHEVGRVRFNPKQDSNRANYVKPGNVFHFCGAAPSVPEFVAVESRPHEPLFDDHYYAYRPIADYVPDGRKLAELLRFFDNAKTPVARALIAAFFLTPGWGGPYGKRPCAVITAPDRGCGKSTLAWAIGRIWGGMLDIELSKRAEEDLITRLLTPDALMKRLAVLDNVKGVVSSATLEKLITTDVINGRRLYTGDASRPNTLTYMITANGVRLSRDMSLRSFFITLDRPSPSADWERQVAAFVATHADEVIADCIAILREKPQARSAPFKNRFPLWCEEVLHRACSHPALAEVIGDVTVADVVEANALTQAACDDDLEEAQTFARGVLDLVAREHGFITDPNDGDLVKPFIEPKADVFVPSPEMCEYWQTLFNRKVNARWLVHRLREHREAGRIVGFEETHTRQGNGFTVQQKLLAEHVRKAEQEHDAAQQNAWPGAAVGAVAGGGSGEIGAFEPGAPSDA